MKNVKNKIKKIVAICSLMSVILVNASIPARAVNKYTLESKYIPATKVLDTTTNQPLDVIDGSTGTYSNPNIQIEGLLYIPNNYKMNVQQNMEYQVFDLINQKRVENGLQPLLMDETLQKVARYKCADMIQNNYFSHENLQGVYCHSFLRTLKMPEVGWAENILYCGSQYTAQQSVDLWWNSEGHKNNILNSEMKYTGLGVVCDESHGILYMTQEFTS